MKKFTSDDLHSFIMAYMVNNNIKELVIRPPKHNPDTKLYLNFYISSDDIGNFIKIMLDVDECENSKKN